MLRILIFLTIASCNLCYSQTTLADTLRLTDYLDLVMDNHPLVLQAQLNEEIQEAYRLKSKGTLDPKLNSGFQSKSFDDKNYFDIWQTEAKIPTRLPVDISLGYERNNGQFLNPENSVPDNGLVYGTLNISLLRGLLFDEQRYQIREAELKGLKSQIDQELLIREILTQAINTYIQWAEAARYLELTTAYRALIQDRHLSVIQLFINGDKPAIDTIESRLNINSADKLILDAKSLYIDLSQKLSLFIWDKAGNPLFPKDNLTPEPLERITSILQAEALITNPIFNNDPLIRKIDNQIATLELTNRLEKEQLKPQLDLKYNTILNLGDNNIDPTFRFNDYKYGVAFQMPLRNRKIKGELRLNETFIKQNSLEKTQYIGQLQTKYEALVLKQQLLNEQQEVSRMKISNSNLLLEAEQLKFDLGESSIFLLNKRELKVLEAETELIANLSKLGAVLTEINYLRLGQQ